MKVECSGTEKPVWSILFDWGGESFDFADPVIIIVSAHNPEDAGERAAEVGTAWFVEHNPFSKMGLTPPILGIDGDAYPVATFRGDLSGAVVDPLIIIKHDQTAAA